MKYQQKIIRQVPVEATYKLRQAILRPGLHITRCILPHDLDHDVFHLAAYRCMHQVGIVSAYPLAISSEPQAWQLRAMATVPWVRHQGYGLALLQAAETVIRNRGGKLAWCHARTSAVRFYEKSGFAVKGGKFIIPRVGEHYLMLKFL